MENGEASFKGHLLTGTLHPIALPCLQNRIKPPSEPETAKSPAALQAAAEAVDPAAAEASGIRGRSGFFTLQ